MNRRGIGSTAIAGGSSIQQIDPSDVTGIVEWWDVGLSYSGAAWLGQFAGNDMAQSDADLRGTLTASDATLNGAATLSFNGTSQWRRCTTIDRPAPATAFTTCIMVAKQRTWTLTGSFISQGVGTMRLTQQANTPEIAQANGTAQNPNDAGTLGAWRRLECIFSNTALDHVKVGGKTIHGTACGNNDGGRVTLAASDTPAAFGAIDVAWVGIFSGQVAMAHLSALDAYFADRFGSGIL